MKLPKVLLALPILVALAAGGWYYYTTTDAYAFNQVKAACESNDMTIMIKLGVAHINGETREFTDDEKKLFLESLEKINQQTDCPYQEAFAKKVTKTKLPQSELDRLKVADGLKYTFEGESDQKSLKLIKFDGKWRMLLVDANFGQGGTTSPPPVQQGVPSGPDGATPQYQIDINSDGTSAPPAPSYR